MAETRRLETQQSLRAAIVVAVVRDGDGARAERSARALIEGGMTALEITATTPQAFDTIARLRRDFPHAVLGIGTVRRPEHVDAAADAGGAFIVSPHTDQRLIDRAHARGLAAIPGGLTATEIVTARDGGADFVKVFPVAAVGGPRYIRLLRGPLPEVSYWVSGGVALEEIGDYLAAGVDLIGLTAALTADLPEAPEQAAALLKTRAKAALDAVDAYREGAPLLTVVVGDRRFDLGMKAIRRLPGAEHTRLEALVPGRRGHAVRMRMLLQSAGIPPGADVRIVSHDGFSRRVSAQALADGGLLHYATDGHPLGRDQGGPLRLYIVQGTDQCDNVKGLARIEAVSAS